MATDLYTIKLNDEFTQPAKQIDNSASRLQNMFASLGASAKRLVNSISNVGKTSTIVSPKVTKLGTDSEKAGKKVGGLASTLLSFGGNRISGGVQQVAGSFGELIPAIGRVSPAASAALGGIVALGAAAYGLGKGVSDLSKFRGELVGITGSAKGADASLETIRKLASETGDYFGETAELFIGALRRGFTEVDSSFLVRLNDQLGDLNASNPEAVSTAMEALQKSLTSGKINSKTLTALNTAGLKQADIFKNLSKITGKSMAEVQKDLEKGKISVAQFGKAVTMTASALGPAEQSIPTMLKEIGSTLQNELVNPILFKVLPAIIQFTKSFVAGFKEFAKTIKENSATIISTLKGIAIVLGVLATAFVVMQAAAIAAWALAFLPIALVIAGIVAVGYAIGQLIDNWGTIKEWASGIWSSVTSFFTDLVSTISSMWDSFSLVDVGKNLVLGLVNGIASMHKAAVDAVSNLGSGVIDAAKDVFGINSPSKVFEYQGKMVDEGLALGIERHDNMVLKSAQDMSQGAINESQSAFQSVSGGSITHNTGAQAGMASAEGGSSTTVQAPVSVNLTVEGGGSDAKSVTEQIKKYLEEEFSVFLERHLEGAGA